MWESNDKKNYHLHKEHNVGQIYNDSFSLKIRELAGMVENKTFLEIGTWNGLGSTKQFLKMFYFLPFLLTL